VVRALEIVCGCALVGLNLLDVFQAVILPRATGYRWRISARLTRFTWPLYTRFALRITDTERREDFLGTYAPLLLVAFLVVWSAGLVVGYGLIIDGARAQLRPAANLGEAIYFSGISFLTIGYGDFVPSDSVSRLIGVVAGASGLSVVAIVAAFLFVLSGSFAARENYVVTFSTRAGAPPSGVSLIAAYAELGILDDLDDVFEEGITWCASVLESHLSYPLLAYFRSSHDRESWIATVGALLDAATLKLTLVEDGAPGHAKLCYNMARHLVGDLAHYFGLDLSADVGIERQEFETARARLVEAGLRTREAALAWDDFRRMRSFYAVPLNEMAQRFRIPPAQWIGDRSYLRLTHRLPPATEQTSAPT